MRLILPLALLLALGGPAAAQPEPAAAPAAPTAAAAPTAGQADAVPPPSAEQLRELSALLRDPGVQQWLQQGAAAAGATASAPAAIASAPATTAAAPAASPPPAAATASLSEAVKDLVDRARAFLAGIAAAAPGVPDELRAAADRLTAQDGFGVLPVVALLAAFFGCGLGLEALARRAARPFRARLAHMPVDTPRARVRSAAARTLYGLLLLAAFAAGSVGAFLLFPWPPLLATVVLDYLGAILLVRIVLVAGRLVLSPQDPARRMVPLGTPAAQFWTVWAAVLVGWFHFIQTTIDALHELGVSRHANAVIGLVFAVVLIALTLWTIWRQPMPQGSEPASRTKRLSAWLLSLYVVAAWFVLLSGSVAPFYVAIVLLLLPIALKGLRHAVRHLGHGDAAAAPHLTHADATPRLITVSIEHLLRAAILIAAGYFVAWQIGLDFDAMSNDDGLGARLARGAVNAFVVVLIADLIWRVARAWIDHRIAQDDAAAAAALHVDEGGGTVVVATRSSARLRTLLPMMKNLLLVLVVVVASITALSSIGVDVGPLVAGAGVVGLAVGFGAQTLVKDLISGVFFLVDDAFRVGEYIESGSIKGTVEAFSLRSIKIRHQRGALHTVPFGSIDKITNYSRDYTIDKFTLGVTYDTDLEKARKIIKKIGAELQADPEMGPKILEPLKMQGLDSFGEYAIQIRLKMTTKPGENFTIRRKAFALINREFAANGIEFARPIVRVAGGDADAAASRLMMERQAAAAADMDAER